MRCRHRTSWILGGVWEWCYRCGALLQLSQDGNGVLRAASRWVKPTGPDGANPWAEIEKPPIKRKRETPA